MQNHCRWSKKSEKFLENNQPIIIPPTPNEQYESLQKQFICYKKALDYCLSTLKHHHTTKNGISALIKHTEDIRTKSIT